MKKVHRLRTARELRALASPERQDIVQALAGRRALSVRELAAVLGRLPVSLYYHLRALEKIGVVEQAGSRVASKGEEALYRVVAREIHIVPAKRGAGEVRALRRLAAGLFRRAHRLHDALVVEPPTRNRLDHPHTLVQRTVRLDAAGLRRVNKLLFELAHRIHDPRVSASDGEAAFYTVTLHLARNGRRGAVKPSAAPRRRSRT